VDVMQYAPMATLRLFADNLPPQVIQTIIDQKPDVAVNKGDALSKKPGGGVVTTKQGTWFITTEHRDLGPDPDKHLAWAVSLARSHWDDLTRVVPDIRADFSLLVHDKKFSVLDIPRSLLRKTVSVGELEIEVPSAGADIILSSKNLNRELTKLHARKLAGGQDP
jgi:hypothetical protein